MVMDFNLFIYSPSCLKLYAFVLQRMVIFIFCVSIAGKLQAGFSGKKIAKCYNSQIDICKIEILQIYILGNKVSCKILAWIRPSCKIGNLRSRYIAKFQPWIRPCCIISNLHCEYLGKFVLERLSCIKESWNHGTILFIATTLLMHKITSMLMI